MDILKGVMLSSWNSISGPQIERFWFPENHLIFHYDGDLKWNINGYDVPKYKICPMTVQTTLTSQRHKMYKTQLDYMNAILLDVKKCLTMSGKLLIAEIESRKRSLDIGSRVYCLENELLIAEVFCKKPWLDDWTNSESHNSCIAILLDCPFETMSVELHRIVDIHLRKIIDCMQQSGANTPSLMAEEIAPKLGDICSIILDTFYSPPVMEVKDLFAHFYGNSDEFEFLCSAVSSHIQTGYSVVTGDMKTKCAKIVRILLTLHSEEEKRCSNKKATQASSYFSGFRVQYVKKYQYGYRVSLPPEVYKDYPMTIIDSETAEAEQTLPEGSSQMVKSVKQCGSLVENTLTNAVAFEENKLNTAFVMKTFSRFLSVKAMALTRIIEEFRAQRRTPTEKQLMHLLNLKELADLRVCLGRAEEFEPGIKLAIAPSN